MTGISLKVPDPVSQGFSALPLLIELEGDGLKCWAEGGGDPGVEVDGGGCL